MSSSSSTMLNQQDECDLLEAAWQGLLLTQQQGGGTAIITNPYRTCATICAVATLTTFVVSTLAQNYSQVDKLWSILPVVYAWTTVFFASFNKRTILMAVVATIWGIRLTWNFHRRGGYSTWPQFWRGDEDYRWAEIQKGQFIQLLTNPVAWALFNFGFISLYQNVLLLLIATPSLVANTVATTTRGNNNNDELVWLDYVAASLVVLFVVIEAVADNQQFAFQTEKYARCRNKQNNETETLLTGEYADGFKQSGLFAIVRKPNYAAEQAVWISFYLFTVAATNQWWNWSAVGWILLCLLFQTSGWFTERLTRQKYPKYNEYMKHAPLYIPNPIQCWKLATTGSKTNKVT